MKYSPFCFAIVIATTPLAASSLKEAEAPPTNIIEHYHWCLTPKSRRDSLSRLEGFWRQHHPANEECGDAIDGRFVRLCAYRLTALYIADGQKEKASEMLRWLEAHDIEFPK